MSNNKLVPNSKYKKKSKIGPSFDFYGGDDEKSNYIEETPVLNFIKKLTQTAKFKRIAIRILIDIALSFKIQETGEEIGIPEIIDILKGANVKITNDHCGYWTKWKYWVINFGNCPSEVPSEVSAEDEILTQPLEKGECLKWVPAGDDRWSSHESVTAINSRGRSSANVIHNSIDQYEIIMGKNEEERDFSMLCGVGSNPSQRHNKLSEDDPEYKVKRKDLFTWFQFEKSAATGESGIRGLISHTMDWARYKKTGENQGPFGGSIRKDSNPLQITCCDNICKEKKITVTRGKNTIKATAINDNVGDIHTDKRLPPNKKQVFEDMLKNLDISNPEGNVRSIITEEEKSNGGKLPINRRINRNNRNRTNRTNRINRRTNNRKKCNRTNRRTNQRKNIRKNWNITNKRKNNRLTIK